jgi:hypothetical protein
MRVRLMLPVRSILIKMCSRYVLPHCHLTERNRR